MQFSIGVFYLFKRPILNDRIAHNRRAQNLYSELNVLLANFQDQKFLL